MGNETSTAAEHCGYRIIGVQEKSSAAKLQLVPFFDFIIAANGIRLDQRDSSFMEIIASFEDRPLSLTIFNIKSNSQRDVIVTPTRNWEGQGLLGITIRFDTFEDSDSHVIHVLDVAKGSPAELAGLIPYSDYLLGTAETAFVDFDIFFDCIQQKVDKPVDIYVYNVESDEIRVVTLLPNSKWGGDSLLGAEVGNGILHRLPEECKKTNGKAAALIDVRAYAQVALPGPQSLASSLPQAPPPPAYPAPAGGPLRKAGPSTPEKDEAVLQQQPLPPPPPPSTSLKEPADPPAEERTNEPNLPSAEAQPLVPEAERVDRGGAASTSAAGETDRTGMTEVELKESMTQ